MMAQNEVVYLCPGEHHSIVCSTNQTLLQWIIRVPPHYHGSHHWIQISSPLGYYNSWSIGHTTINFTKRSEPGVLPLKSTLLIKSVATGFNGTMIACYNNIPEFMMLSIHVINGKVLSRVQIDSDSIYNACNNIESVPPEFEVMISERFGTTNITVTMEWTSARDDVWYSVSTEPQVDAIFTRDTSIQLIALYNTHYNVTIVAYSALCNTGIGRVGFNYSEFFCGDIAQPLIAMFLLIVHCA